MVFGFVTQSGGHVAVQSEEGEGTTVRLYLPHAEQAGEAAPDATEAPSITGGDETILVVEDNEKMRAVVERQLRGLGYRVLSAENAAAALETLAKGAAIDLLFSDIVMPGDMNGFELAREVSLRHAGIRVLLTSGFAETRIGDDGTSDLPRPKLLSKPYRLVELARAVREVIDGPET
jgi:CheY-like chemotaxis protein